MKDTRLQKILFTAVSVLFLIYSITLLYPFLWMFVNSLKTNSDFFQNIWNFPENPLWSNYVEIWDTFDLFTLFFNSFTLSGLCAIVGLMSSCCVAYVVSKYPFKLSQVLYAVAVIFMLIPGIGTLASTYKFMVDTHLINTHLGIVLMSAGGINYTFILLHSFFKGISWSYAEAAFIDGASDFQVFYRVMLPQAKPGLFALGITAFINYWNDYFTPYLYLYDEDKMTLAVGIYNLVQRQSYAANWPLMFAGMIVSLVPTILIFAVFNKMIMENVVAGGLKG